jgi:amino acid permease
MTFVSLIKGFIGTAILFLAREVNLGGWFMTIFSLTISAILTHICAMKLLAAAKDC